MDHSVEGWSHITVFIAGHKMHGLVTTSQALNTQRVRLSLIPQDTFARKSAEIGATKITSAHRLYIIGQRELFFLIAQQFTLIRCGILGPQFYSRFSIPYNP